MSKQQSSDSSRNPKPSVVRVAVTPGARREIFTVKGIGSFEVSVKEPAEGNQANTRVRELLASHFGVSGKRVRFVSGARSRTKRFEVIE